MSYIYIYMPHPYSWRIRATLWSLILGHLLGGYYSYVNLWMQIANISQCRRCSVYDPVDCSKLVRRLKNLCVGINPQKWFQKNELLCSFNKAWYGFPDFSYTRTKIILLCVPLYASTRFSSLPQPDECKATQDVHSVKTRSTIFLTNMFIHLIIIFKLHPHLILSKQEPALNYTIFDSRLCSHMFPQPPNEHIRGRNLCLWGQIPLFLQKQLTLMTKTFTSSRIFSRELISHHPHQVSPK